PFSPALWSGDRFLCRRRSLLSRLLVGPGPGFRLVVLHVLGAGAGAAELVRAALFLTRIVVVSGVLLVVNDLLVGALALLHDAFSCSGSLGQQRVARVVPGLSSAKGSPR